MAGVKRQKMALQYVYSSQYFLPASPEEVDKFFSDTRNISGCWPRELGLKIVESSGDEYVAIFKLLGQTWKTRFRILRRGELSQLHETLDFPFGKLTHEIVVGPAEGETVVKEELRLSYWIPFAGRFFEPILRYREAMIKRCFGVDVEAEYRDPFRISLVSGTAISLIAIAVAGLLLYPPSQQIFIIDLILRLVSWGLLWFFTHDIAHLLVGALVGVKFSHYYLGLSNIVRLNLVPQSLKPLILALGIRIDRERSKATPQGYAAMYAAGPLASMLTPLIVPAILLLRTPNDPTGLILAAASAANILFTSYFSPKAGCLDKAARALKKKEKQKPRET